MTTPETPQETPAAENLTKHDIRLCYKMFLDRIPSDSEVERMQAAHNSLDSVRRVFLKSSEFAQRYAPFSGKNRAQQISASAQPSLQKLAQNLQPCNADRVVFLHIPKCGGTTLHHMLGQWFGPDNMHAERHNGLYSYTAGNLASSLVFSGHYDFYATTLIPGPKRMISFLRDPADRLVSLYHFHRAHAPDIIERHNLTLPRWANEYDIDAYFAHPNIRKHPGVNNAIVRYFSDMPQIAPSMKGNRLPDASMDEMMEQALRNLEKFTFVGFMDRYNADVDRLADTLGCKRPVELRKHQVLDDLMKSDPNMRKIDKQKPSQETRDSMEELIQYDRKFYDRARELFA
ncbi:sulfotransferase family 2 domain-containing protein [Phaeobacter sp. J2-8]|uniref:sulfotransferase family 2 domain-containing protein n=1 Tax=Phaeobacter sp. J2-8 TaxID=2931394 RepID=UPI001FD408A1|nr:sulfotransferase family 2 domain-containing protein [Phaeobacter sp. J2-8]MCJ7874836.1 sulfotransferase family protein [Phaeobacter sp. J2-8]